MLVETGFFALISAMVWLWVSLCMAGLAAAAGRRTGNAPEPLASDGGASFGRGAICGSEPELGCSGSRLYPVGFFGPPGDES